MSYTIQPKTSTLMSSTKSNLTPEQLQRMEENRLKALAKKQGNAKPSIENVNPNKVNTIHTTSTKPPSIFNNPAVKPSIFNNPSKINTIHTIASKQASAGSKTTTDSFAKSTVSTSSNSSSQGIIDSVNGKCIPLEEDPENRFEIIIGYNKGMIDLFKTIQGRKYDPNTKRWNFSRKKYDEILLQIKIQLNNTVKLEPLDRTSGNTVFVKFFLINKERFEAVSEFKPELNELYKTMRTKNYESTSKKWSFDLCEYNALVNSINTNLKASVTIVPLPKTVKEIFKEKIAGEKADINDHHRVIDFEHLKAFVDPTITKTLLPFQIDSICFAIKQEGRLLLADDMGLGKTIQGLGVASYYREEWPLFIVCPSSVKFMWKENAKRWISPSIREVCGLDEDDSVDQYIQVMENGRQKIEKQSRIVITSYDLLAKNVDKISEVHYKMVIADECHLLKNIKAGRTKAALKLLQNAKRVLLMSGTPALSRPSELFSQVQAINPSLFHNFHEFGIRYCDGKETKFGMDYTGYSNMNELRTVLEEKLLIRREKRDVLSQLPSKMRETIVLNPALIELNSKSLKHASKAMQTNKSNGKADHGLLLNYFQETSKVKAKAVAEYALDLLESGKKFLIFAHHQSMLNALQTELEEKQYDFIRIDGSTNSEKRQEYVDKFQKDENCLCALLSITAANSGITLTAASLVCFAELYWNPGILVQAEDRVYRIGQKNAVNIQYLCAQGTADDEIWPLVKDKLDVLSKAGLTKESMNNTKQSVMQSSEDDIQKLNALNELIKTEKKKNKITNYTESTGSENLGDESEKISKSKSVSKSKEANPKTNVTTSKAKIDELLKGVDFDETDEIVEIKSSIGKKKSPTRKLADVSHDDDDLLNGVNLDAFEEGSPPKKQKSIFKKKKP